MRLKLNIPKCLGYASSFLILMVIMPGLFYYFYHQDVLFSERDAFISVYGNYDSVHKSAIWNNMELPSNIQEFNKGVWKNKTGSVSQVFLQSFQENGKHKVVFITKTIPKSEPYECHACFPIINATIFVKNKKKWDIASQNLFLIQEGEYAASPMTRLIQLGPDKYGVTLEFEHRNGESLAKTLYLIVPYKKSIMNVLEENIYFDNFNGCGWSIQCSTFSSTLVFDKASKDRFYPLKIKRFGTQNDEKQHDRAVPMDEEATYQFQAGKYVQINWKGYPKINYEKSLG